MSDAELGAIRARHHRVCTFCGGSPDDAHEPEWRDYYTCSCRDALCPQRLLDAAEARELALWKAVDLAYRWVNFTPEGVDGLRSWMRRALFAEPTEGGS